jgi:hypothetical protein
MDDRQWASPARWISCYANNGVTATYQPKHWIMADFPTRKKHMTRLSKLVDPMIEPSARARGFVFSRLISQWQQIAGDMASWCQPVELRFNKSETRNGTLKLAIASGRGPEANQQAENMISRVNTAFGYAAVSRLTFVQTFQTKPLRPEPPEVEPPDAQTRHNQSIWALDEKLQQVKSPALRAALRRLGTPRDNRGDPAGTRANDAMASKKPCG